MCNTCDMAYIIADNILSPLGETTEQNYNAVLNGNSALAHYSHKWNLPISFCASLFTEEQNKRINKEELTHFESMVLFSIKQAIAQTQIDISSPRVVLVLSTTKGNVEILGDNKHDIQTELPGKSAQKIASILGMTSSPIVVCNACISGVSAIIIASRLIESKVYDYVIVCGADSQSPFIVSGFQSLMALSETVCKPFDMERTGLNLGEAAATIILSNFPKDEYTLDNSWCIENGVIRNDSYHISAPSKKGEGAYLALRSLVDKDVCGEVAFINAHGTATMFNDQMESVAIERSGLSNIPVNAYKGYYGHTMGAAGVLETILSMKALSHNMIIGTKEFNELGVSGKINVLPKSIETNGKKFIKMISGFGGCNASMLVSKGEVKMHANRTTKCSHKVTHHVIITTSQVILDDRVLLEDNIEGLSITSVYKHFVDDYPKFYKMDKLSRLGFVASELLLKAENSNRHEGLEDRAIIIFNSSSSIDSDLKYQKSIENDKEFFPSPSVFVYTLPNIVTGEIALRHRYYGETSFYILPSRNDLLMDKIILSSTLDQSITSILTGWLDYYADNNYIADLKLIEF